MLAPVMETAASARAAAREKGKTEEEASKEASKAKVAEKKVEEEFCHHLREVMRVREMSRAASHTMICKGRRGEFGPKTGSCCRTRKPCLRTRRGCCGES